MTAVPPRSRPAHAAASSLATVGIALLSSLALVPAARADDTQANTWSGGGLPAARGAGARAVYPRSGVLVSLVTVAPRARIHVEVHDPLCGIGTTIPSGSAAVAPGGDGLYEALTVNGHGTETYRSAYGSTRLRATVALAPAAPGVLGGTVRVTGTTHDAKRPHRCDLTVPVTVRSHQSLLVPRAPGSVDAAAPRTGLVDVSLPRRLPGAIAITKRADGRLHAMWSIAFRCRTGGRRFDDPAFETAKRFPVRAGGAFSGVERSVRRGVSGGDRFVYRYESRITGRIGSDGIARGTVSNASSTTWPGGKRRGTRCGTGTRRFVAAS
jgi:hypothetical protein